MDFARLPTASPADVPADAVLLDVREPEEWAAGHAEGALHVPMGQVIQRIDEILDHAAEQPLYVMCKMGGRSAQVAAFLNQQGINAINVDGGLAAWQTTGRPMTSDTGTDPFVL
jgi:rhodanese-related sulfurtransferase